MNTNRWKILVTSKLVKVIAAILFSWVFVSIFFTQITYGFYLSGIYPFKAQIKGVSIEFNNAWLPAFSSESPVGQYFGAKFSPPATMFYKIDGLKSLPIPNGIIVVSWVGDKFEATSRTQDIYSKTIHFDWGTANILKRKASDNQTNVLAVVPEFQIMIDADNLDQLNEIRSLKKISIK